MEKYRNNHNKLVTMTIHDLEDLVYTASLKSAKRVEKELFGGLIPFINRLYDENEQIIETLEHIKLTLQESQKKKPSTRKKKSENKAKEVVETQSTLADIKFSTPLESLSEEDRKRLSEVIKHSIELNRPVINIPPIPELKRNYDE
jgi:hypothetical protein